MSPKMLRNGIFISGALILLALATIIYAFLTLDSATIELKEAEKNKIESYLLAYELKQASSDLTKYSRSYAMTGEKKYKDRFNYILGIKEGTNPRPLENHRIYWDMVVNPGDKPRPDGEPAKINDLMVAAGFTQQEMDLVKKADRVSGDMVRLERKAMNAIEGKFEDSNGNFTVTGAPDRGLAINTIYGDQFQKFKAATMGNIDKVFESMEARTDKRIDNAVDQETFAERLFYLSSLLLLAFIASFVTFGVLQNRQRLAETTAARKKAEDENETLNNSVINILQTMQSLSQRDLTAKAPVTEDIIGTVSDSVNQLTDETAKVLREVTNVANQVENASTKVQAQASLVSQTAENERQSVLQMTSALSEATNSMTEVATLAEHSNDSAAKAAMATQDALNTVSSTVNEMESIRETIAQTEKRIKRLGERSQEISGIVGLINTISERTHVLALNASMQAAVAGEAGRGFAVVAEEVQRLAESSRNATEQIETLVKNIQVDTNETINTVNQTIARVVQGSEQAEKAGEQMQKTRQITAELVAQVQQIAEAAESQKVMSNNLLMSVEEIGAGTELTARQIEEQNKETAQLQEAAKNLVDSVSVFTLPPNAA